jgi:tetratricopeptide (TPR) repeat protein
MRHIRLNILLSLAVTSLLALLIFPDAGYAGECEKWIAKAVSVQGSVQSRFKDAIKWNSVELDNTFCPGDMIRVQERGRAAILMINETIVRLDQNTTITFEMIEKKKTSLLDIIRGAVHFISRVPRTLRVSTPFVNGTVEGTEFLVRVYKDHAVFSVFEGEVRTANQSGSLALKSGQSAVAEAGKAPVLKVIVKPEDAVQWALFYPPVMQYQEGALEEVSGTRLFIERAAFLLSVGRVDEALSFIDKALKSAPGNGHAVALNSIIALAQNDKDRALGLAREAVKADPGSAAVRIALSYAQQADFDLKGALKSLQKAVMIDKDSSLAWARLSEVLLSSGDLDGALEAAMKAVENDPDTARTQAVLGFAYLAQAKTRASLEAFKKAVVLDQADPLPRFGMGLARIREGDLEEGRQEIEIAASLDPNNSLVRSYLGKAYYEEKRDQEAASQLETAAGLDPLDPTPLFYNAIRKQSLNRPVEALHDLQRSIELNDNRAVYRSKQLLDEDLAARSSGLARIYSDLGFEQLALVEGWRSVNVSPGNYSAHRFLADSYAALPRHEVARVSELLQSQLLQPINITPVQPQLAEGGLFILNGAGPGRLSFNEFNALFNRNRFALQLSGVVGENSTFGNDLVVSGVNDNISISAGQFHYETDGFRENNDLDEDIYNMFAQAQISHKTSVQAEFRYTETDAGDLNLRFDPENFFESLRIDEKTSSLRLGFHHSFSRSSDVIGSFIYRTFDSVENVDENFSIEGHADGYISEIQHLFNSQYFQLISGAGHFDSELDDTVDFFPFFTEETESDIHHNNLYIYSKISYLNNLVVTLGGSYDSFNDGAVEKDQFNPKAGLTWTPFSGTTFRAAAFQAFKRVLISDQTLEPTQVAGFNQFFDDVNGTESRRYGIGIDQKFPASLFGGFELSRRELEVPVTDMMTFEMVTKDWDETLGRAYLYWTPHPWLSLSVEYQYEKLEREPDAPSEDDIIELKTNRLPVGVGFFHPSGLFSRIKGTYVKQEGEFFDFFAGFVSGQDRFWVFDAAVGYRMPNRLGVFSIEARNLFDEEFNFQDTDPKNPDIYPERLVLGKFTFSF